MVYPPIQTILLAEDSPNDCEVIREAWAESPVGDRLRLVNTGAELLDYLCRQGAFASPESSPRPSVILLDLNMPLMSGAEVLKEMKQDTSLASIPVVVLTTSKAPRDIVQTAGLGINGYIQKPNTYGGYLTIFINLQKHWGEILDRPFSNGGSDWSGNLAWC